MSGVLIAGELLRGAAAVTDLVVPTLIKAWVLPEGSPPPSIVVTRPSRAKHQFLDEQEVWLITERVQVTVRAASGEGRVAILRAAERACVDKVGTIAGFHDAAVTYAGGGPDFMDVSGTIFMGSFDLRISFNEPA